MEKKITVIVDYQVDFVNGSLGFSKAVQLEDKIYNKVKSSIDNDDIIVFTHDTHFADYLGTREGKALPVPHCIKGTEGHKLYGKLQDFANWGYHKNKSTFALSDRSMNILLLDIFNNIGKNIEITEVELVGVVTNLCVISNAIKFQTTFPNATITVDTSCCASNDDNLHEEALDVMESLQINVINREG